MKTVKKLTLGSVALSVSLLANALTAQDSSAVMSIIGSESGGNVVFSYSGSIITDGLAAPVSNGFTDAIAPSGSAIVAGQDEVNNWYFQNLNISGPASFGTGGLAFGTGTGDIFGFALTLAIGAPALQLPNDYDSGDDILGSLTFTGTDFATLGVDSSQSYEWILTDANNGLGDSVRLEFGATAVPLETDALPIVGSLAFMGAGFWVKKRRKGNVLNLDNNS